MTWALLGTLALAIIPLVKPKVDPDKARIAKLEKDIAHLAKESAAAKAYITELELDRTRLREAYLSLLASNQWSHNQQFNAQAQALAPYQQYPALGGLGLASPQDPHPLAQLQAQQDFPSMLGRLQDQATFGFDCTCVPERSAALRGA